MNIFTIFWASLSLIVGISSGNLLLGFGMLIAPAILIHALIHLSDTQQVKNPNELK